MIFSVSLGSGAASKLTLSGYQLEDGAITLQRDGSFVDPYFSTKALLIASQQGMDVTEVTQKWVNWLLNRQLPDGRFMRYCRSAEELAWNACQEADADDAMMGMWVALLAETTQGEMPQEMLGSIDRSMTQLKKLRNPVTGTYFISAANQVSLLMDNVEIYEGYVALSRYFQSHGANMRKKEYEVRATAIAASIEQVFWEPSLRRYRVTTQARRADDFYPDRVAQIFPLLGGLPDLRRDRRSAYKAWLRMNKNEWQTLRADYFPWGLVAIVAKLMGDSAVAACWAANAGVLRTGPRWNVLEEAVYEILQTSAISSTVRGLSC
jgi:hypothetical protein